MTLQISEIPKGLPSNFEYFLKINGVDSPLTWLKCNYLKSNFLVKICEIGRQHDIRQIEVLWHLSEILLNKVTLHQPERCVRVRNTDTESQTQNKPESIFNKFPGRSVLSGSLPVAEYCVILISLVPKLFEFLRIGLTIRVSLENPVSAMLECVLISVDEGRTMPAVGLSQRLQQ